jgi:hypothetical protein
MKHKRQKIHHKKDYEASLSDTSLSLSDDIWMEHILPFVDKGNFRFVGGVNRCFRSAYLERYPSATTYDTIITVEQAQLFDQDIHDVRRYTRQRNAEMLVSHEETACRVMARLGRQNVLRYFHSKNFSWNEKTCANAVLRGNLKMLKWLRARGCPWDYDVCSFAAGTGNSEIKKWAHDNGCPCWRNCQR